MALALVLGLASSAAFACPKGTHLVGGSGPHHKDGKCVAAAEASPADAKTADKPAKKAAKSNKAKKKADAAK
jgi:hypothetical protein